MTCARLHYPDFFQVYAGCDAIMKQTWCLMYFSHIDLPLLDGCRRRVVVFVHNCNSYWLERKYACNRWINHQHDRWNGKFIRSICCVSVPVRDVCVHLVISNSLWVILRRYEFSTKCNMTKRLFIRRFNCFCRFDDFCINVRHRWKWWNWKKIFAAVQVHVYDAMQSIGSPMKIAAEFCFIFDESEGVWAALDLSCSSNAWLDISSSKSNLIAIWRQN